MSYVQGKVVFVGDASVGKTSIIYKYTNKTDPIETTIASSSISCTVDYNGTPVTFNAWDTAGQEDYRCLVPMFVKGAQIAIIVFDITNRQSFSNIDKWIEFLAENCSVHTTYLVANKIDLQYEVPLDEVIEYAEERKLKYFLTSAKSGQNVDVLFYTIAEQIHQSTVTAENKAEVTIKPTVDVEEKSCC
ncbi:small GTP-binding protein [Histomonas meleagridis]|uniref:small GTP-binding protein n=1 Tax=Histomonas meleagridis TaxID=135588 RepID=UPI00355A508F|nr:small GTP-binding protein [Histomonas meleagridis]KAH0797308.1 small GTP-binding protein [Histomonas meleagridis]